MLHHSTSPKVAGIPCSISAAPGTLAIPTVHHRLPRQTKRTACTSAMQSAASASKPAQVTTLLAKQTHSHPLLCSEDRSLQAMSCE